MRLLVGGCLASMVTMSIVLLTVISIMFCSGHFMYSLDDPYITLQLATNIVLGHYGLNTGEVASPSSSILFPFILAPFARLHFFALVPLFINSLAAIASAFVVGWVAVSMGIEPERRRVGALIILLFAICIAFNDIGVVFTGLEHSLHILTTILVIFGLAKTLDKGVLPPWLPFLIVLEPLWRFEGFGLALVMLVALVILGHWRASLLALAAIVASVGGHVLAMHSLGLPLLPGSVLAKSGPAEAVVGGGSGIINAVFGNFLYSLRTRWEVYLFALPLAAVVTHPILRLARPQPTSFYRFSWRSELILAGVVIVTAGGHVLVGTWGGFGRYQAYIIAMCLVGALILWAGEITLWLSRAPLIQVLIGCGLILVPNIFSLRATVMTPLAARGVYEQQYQMHRFAVDYYRRAIAVNDLGWVSYKNPNYVLDLWGLASEEARQERMVTHRANWMDRLAREHGIGVAMIYREWFTGEIPATWHRIAVLHPTHAPITAWRRDVDFYTTAADAAPVAEAALCAFAGGLRGEAELEFDRKTCTSLETGEEPGYLHRP
jgi:hypothetical protein